jgi:hypothetical protein
VGTLVGYDAIEDLYRIKYKDDDVEELVVDDKKDKECAPGFHDDGTGLCVPDDDVKEDGCPEGYILDLATNQCVKLDDTKVTVPPKKVVAPKVDTTKVDTKKKTTEDLMADLGLNAPMPSQDPYANIKLMEEAFSVHQINNFGIVFNGIKKRGQGKFSYGYGYAVRFVYLSFAYFLCSRGHTNGW